MMNSGNELSTYNPNSKWDWYEIGGRWKDILLVRENVEDCITKQRIEDIIDRIDYDIKKTKEIISNDAKSNYQITRLKAMNTKSLDIKKRLQELLEEGEYNNGE